MDNNGSSRSDLPQEQRQRLVEERLMRLHEQQETARAVQQRRQQEGSQREAPRVVDLTDLDDDDDEIEFVEHKSSAPPPRLVVSVLIPQLPVVTMTAPRPQPPNTQVYRSSPTVYFVEEPEKHAQPSPQPRAISSTTTIVLTDDEPPLPLPTAPQQPRISTPSQIPFVITDNEDDEEEPPSLARSPLMQSPQAPETSPEDTIPTIRTEVTAHNPEPLVMPVPTAISLPSADISPPPSDAIPPPLSSPKITTAKPTVRSNPNIPRITTSPTSFDSHPEKDTIREDEDTMQDIVQDQETSSQGSDFSVPSPPTPPPVNSRHRSPSPPPPSPVRVIKPTIRKLRKRKRESLDDANNDSSEMQMNPIVDTTWRKSPRRAKKEWRNAGVHKFVEYRTIPGLEVDKRLVVKYVPEDHWLSSLKTPMGYSHRGVFVKKEIPEGTFLGAFTGVRQEIGTAQDASFCFGLQSTDLEIDATVHCNELRFVNSVGGLNPISEANCDTREAHLKDLLPGVTTAIGGIRPDDYILYFYATKTIHKGQELLVNYGEEYLADLMKRRKRDKNRRKVKRHSKRNSK